MYFNGIYLLPFSCHLGSYHLFGLVHGLKRTCHTQGSGLFYWVKCNLFFFHVFFYNFTFLLCIFANMMKLILSWTLYLDWILGPFLLGLLHGMQVVNGQSFAHSKYHLLCKAQKKLLGFVEIQPLSSSHKAINMFLIKIFLPDLGSFYPGLIKPSVNHDSPQMHWIFLHLELPLLRKCCNFSK